MVTILTPVYNRRKVLPRALAAVESQTYRNIEYIIVDDGSAESIDDIVIPFAERVDFPVLYLVKPNGGVYAARNLAISRVRGQFSLFLDSDDEFISEAIEIFLRNWQRITVEKRHEYREVVGFCMTADGKQIGESWPSGINEMSKDEAKKARRHCKGEHSAMLRTDTLKANPWPEPEGVNFTEAVVWGPLDKKYNKYFINESIRIYHTGSENSLSSSGNLGITSVLSQYSLQY